MSGGWNDDIPEKDIKWQQLPLSQEQFEVHLNFTTGEVNTTFKSVLFFNLKLS